MKVSVDQDKCIGCGACVAISPENFDFNDDGLSTVKNEEMNDKTMDAVEACPTFAISVNKENCECGDDCTCGDECECGESCCCHDDDCCDCDECECDDHECECEHCCHEDEED